MSEKTIHDTRSYWRGCRCIRCRAAYADYCRERYMARAKGESGLVPIKRARQLLLTFESSGDAARVTKLPQSTCYRILKQRVKYIKRQTEKQIVKRAA